MVTREILNSHTVATLKKEISNVKKELKVTGKKKPEIIELMLKNKNLFSHIKLKDKKKPVPKKAVPKKTAAKKAVPTKAAAKKSEPKKSLPLALTAPPKEKDCIAKRSGEPTKPKDDKDYKKQTLKYHPDKNKDCVEYASEKFKKLQALHSGDLKPKKPKNEKREEIKKFFKDNVFKDFTFKIRFSKNQFTFIYNMSRFDERQIIKKLQKVKKEKYPDIIFRYSNSS